jgi:hypothetical protein
MDKDERARLLSAYQRYLDAFSNSDIDTIDKCIK